MPYTASGARIATWLDGIRANLVLALSCPDVSPKMHVTVSAYFPAHDLVVGLLHDHQCCSRAAHFWVDIPEGQYGPSSELH